MALINWRLKISPWIDFFWSMMERSGGGVAADIARVYESIQDPRALDTLLEPATTGNRPRGESGQAAKAYFQRANRHDMGVCSNVS